MRNFIINLRLKVALWQYGKNIRKKSPKDAMHIFRKQHAQIYKKRNIWKFINAKNAIAVAAVAQFLNNWEKGMKMIENPHLRINDDEE